MTPVRPTAPVHGVKAPAQPRFRRPVCAGSLQDGWRSSRRHEARQSPSGRDTQLGTGEAPPTTRVRSRLRTSTSLMESVPRCRVRPSRLRNSTSTPSGGSSSTTVPTSPARISGSPEPFSTATMSSSSSRRAAVTSIVHLRVCVPENIAGDQAWHAFAGPYNPCGTNHGGAIRACEFEVDHVSATVPVHLTERRIAGCGSFTKGVDQQAGVVPAQTGQRLEEVSLVPPSVVIGLRQ